jgi:hypothetical protein
MRSQRKTDRLAEGVAQRAYRSNRIDELQESNLCLGKKG